MTLRVGINAMALLSPLTGIGHYVRSLITELRAEREVDLNLFYGSNWSRELRQTPLSGIGASKNFVKRFVPSPYRILRAASQMRFSAGLRKHRLDVYHEPSLLAFDFEGPSVLTVHDLAWVIFPQTHPADRVANMNRLFPRSLEAATHIITDAEFIRGQVIEMFGIAPARISCIPLAAREIFRPLPAEDCRAPLAAYKLEYRRFLLAVGTVEPRKNLALTVRAFSALPAAARGRFPLVIVGMRGWLASPLEKILEPLVRAGEARILGYVDEAALAVLYASCRAMIYPSLYEGFGLPPLEAMASGAPVIVSNASTLPEVVGAAGILVEPTDVDALRGSIAALLEDEAMCARLREAGLERAARFSWQRCAQQTAQVYRQAAATGGGAAIGPA